MGKKSRSMVEFNNIKAGQPEQTRHGEINKIPQSVDMAAGIHRSDRNIRFKFKAKC